MTTITTPRPHRVNSRRRAAWVRSLHLLPGHIFAWTYAVLLVIPIYYLIVSAFKTNLQVFATPFALPRAYSFENFSIAWDRGQLGSALISSLLITCMSAIVTLVLAVPASYGLARAHGRLGSFVEKLFAMGFLIPGFAALIPTALLAMAIGLFQTRTFMILFLPATALPLSVILLTQFMRTVPAELEESATLDGAGRWEVLWHIYLPIALPGISTVTILNLINFWNEYLFTLILGGSDPAIRTIQVALPTFVSETHTEYGVLAAGTMISLIPVYVAYVLLSRQMEDALLQGALKG